ncbi:MAG TPA: hypothetical protein VM240_05680 [Verrucomicrobiae bacterium]|nr:hypothetical protein [Verrucomicrobiae bacterium]
MLDNRNFWLANMAVLLVIYAIGLALALEGQFGHVMVRLSAIILAAHLLEIPLAFRQLKDRKPNPLKAALLTFVFGLVWWVPARRGIFTAN